MITKPDGDPLGPAALGRIDPGWRTGLLGQQKRRGWVRCEKKARCDEISRLLGVSIKTSTELQHSCLTGLS